MKNYSDMTRNELISEKAALEQKHKELVAENIKIDMARGKPCSEQLDLGLSMMDVLGSDSNYLAENGIDCRNYGGPSGIPEAKRLFAEYLGVGENEIIITGSQSTTFISSCIARAMLKGVPGSERPWSKEEKIKFICLEPGYDKHFTICEFYGIEMVTAKLNEDGPDMDRVEELAAGDKSVKGIWCVPKYSNPSGCVYSDVVVERLAKMETAAPDFRIFWDNAYAVHYIYKDVPLANILEACKKYGHADRPFIFGSTSKVTFPAAGVSFFGASEANVNSTLKQMAAAGISSYDKINMLRHVRYLKSMDNIHAIMTRQAAILRPKFDAVLGAFERELAPRGAGSWTKPEGGYFITYSAVPGCAKRIFELCGKAGVTITGPGSVCAYKHDPEDKYLRIAPSLPPVDELLKAMEVFCIAARLAAVEKILSNK